MLLGNDIVDLQEARKANNWRRPRYLTKLFTWQEREWIGQSACPDDWVWMLWSAKESAYKLSRRLGAKRAYAPKCLEVQQWVKDKPNRYRLQLRTKQTELMVYTDINSSFVHSVAVPNENSNWQEGILPLEGTPRERSEQLREQVCQRIAEADLAVGQETYRIEKDDRGIPQVFAGRAPLPIVLSLSHHGRYGAYCWGRSCT